jgi:two-component system, cell cycle response regulator DivK
MPQKTVLVVEDQLELRAIHTLYLQRHGYHVLAAEDGAQALSAVEEFTPDLIIMDCLMPGVDGLQATERLKGDPKTRDIPVVLLTSLSYGAVGRRARAAGCDGVLSKPCDPGRVLQEVRRRIGDAGAASH